MAKRWYSVSVLSNFEKKIAEQIKQSVADAGLEDQIDEVLVPTEEVIEIRRGKKVTSERRFMPGYVLVHMEMSNRGYHLITSINRVTGFLGPQGKPMPMRDSEVNAILNRVEEGEAQPRNLIRFEVGEQVKVVGRTFRGLRRHGRGSGRGGQPSQGHRLDLRSAYAGRTGIHSGGEGRLSDPVGGVRAPDH